MKLCPKCHSDDTQTQYDQKLEKYADMKVMYCEKTQDLLVDKGTKTTDDVISLLREIKKQNEEIHKDLKNILEGNIYLKFK